MTADLAASGAEHRRGPRAGRARRPRAATRRERVPRRWSRRAKEAIRAGEAFQVVLSQRFAVDCPADALDVYRVLRASNPSPYMYLLRFPAPDGTAYDVVGSSPEALVKVTGRRAITHPIAGSRPARRDPRGGRRPSARSCWPTPRSAPST